MANINVYSHVRPDADAFCTAIAVASILDGVAWFRYEDWKNRPLVVKKILEKDWPGRGAPLGRELVKFFDDDSSAPDGENIAVDCGDIGRVCAPKSVMEKGFDKSFDHHCNGRVSRPDGQEIGGANYPSASAVVAQYYGAAIFPFEATLLYAGLAGDTQLFSNGATTELAFVCARHLTFMKADTNLVSSAMKAMSLGRAKLQAKFLASLKSMKIGGITVNTTKLSVDDFSEAGASRADYAGMPTLALDVADADLAVCYNQDEKEPRLLRIAFRSRNNGLAKKAAVKFNGNGHDDAAGGVIEAIAADATLARVLEEILD